MDGLASVLHVLGVKPGQRNKVLFTCFKCNDKCKVKVAQLVGWLAGWISRGTICLSSWRSWLKRRERGGGREGERLVIFVIIYYNYHCFYNIGIIIILWAFYLINTEFSLITLTTFSLCVF